MADSAFSRTLAHNLHWLLKTRRGPDGRRWTVPKLAADINVREGPGTISPKYIYALLQGDRAPQNPTSATLERLARAFDVPLAVLVADDPEFVEGGLIEQLLDNQGFREAVILLSEMSSDRLATVRKLLEVVDSAFESDTRSVAPATEDEPRRTPTARRPPSTRRWGTSVRERDGD